MTKPKTFSWDEFKAKVTVENKLSKEILEKSDREKIDVFLKDYEKKAESIGSVYWMDWLDIYAVNERYRTWLEERLESVSLKNDAALKPHPAIRYISNAGDQFWFVGTSKKRTVKLNLWTTKEKTKPFKIDESSNEYVLRYSNIKSRKNEYSKLDSFLVLWKHRLKPFPEKGHGPSYYTVSYKTMFVLKGRTNIDNYRGSLSEEKFLEMREILKKSTEKRRIN